MLAWERLEFAKTDSESCPAKFQNSKVRFAKFENEATAKKKTACNAVFFAFPERKDTITAEGLLRNEEYMFQNSISKNATGCSKMYRILQLAG